MKLTLLAIVVFACSLTVKAQNDVKLEINSKLPARYTKNTRNLIATAASQSFPFVELTIKRVTYTIAFDDDDRKIKDIYTSDEDFIDSNGLKVGQEITVKYEDIEVLDYFQLRLKEDKKGWQVVLGGGFARDRDLISRIEKEGQFTTEIAGFAKGYNY
jgi:hypothetical protein